MSPQPGVGDDLAVWCRVREHVPWRHLVPHTIGSVVGRRDGMVEYVRGTADRDVVRARRLLDALAQVRAAAVSDVPLSVSILATWQATALGAPTVGFRRGAAYAKN